MGQQHDDDLIGKIKEKTGWLTADREVEAEGKLRRLRAAIGSEDDEADADDATGDADAAEVAEEAEHDLRQAYGEYDPEVDDAPTAPDVRPVDE